MNRHIILTILTCIILCNVHAQSNLETPALVVGKPVPDFKLDNITHFKLAKASNTDLKGKWLFLDFWSLGCLNCILSFPKVNSFHKEFKEKMNWIMVGNNSKRNKGIREFYEKIRIKQKLEMPVAYDSILFHQWNGVSVPYIVIIDPDGVVRGISDGFDITTERIRMLIAGEKISFNGNAHELPDSTNNMISCSMISKWTGGKMTGGVEVDRWVKWPEKVKKEGYKFTCVPLSWLYNHAYWGKNFWDYDDPDYGTIYPYPIVEAKNVSARKPDTRIGKYSYTLVLSVANPTRAQVMTAMQEDLDRTFDYEVSIEIRPMEVWKLVAKPGVVANLKTKGGDRFVTPGLQVLGFTVRNWPAMYLIACVSFHLQGQFDNPHIPFIDETGLTENFDFTMDADMTNMDDLRKALNKQGLDLIKGTKEMKVLVIRDSTVN